MTPICASPPEASPQTGLTLLELIIALSLIAMTGLILSGNVSFGTRVWESAQSDLLEARKRNRVTRRIVDLVASARPPSPLFGGNGASFEGHDDSIAFRTKPPLALAQGEIRDLILRFVQNKNHLELVILSNSDQLSTRRPEKITHVLDNVETFRIRYFGVDTSGDERWSTLWSGRTDLPALVEFTLTQSGKTIVFSARPRIRGAVGCLLLGSGECKPGGKPEQ